MAGGRLSAAARRLTPTVLFAGFFALYASHSMVRHLRYETGGYDLGIFTQAVAGYARLQPPVAELKGPGANLLGDHFHPILVTIAPLYRLVPSPYTLLAVQAALIAVSVPIVYRAALLRVRHPAALVLALGYGFSWGIAGAVAYEFHEMAFAVPLLALGIHALLAGRFVAAAVWACALVLVKEDLPLTTVMFGVLLFAAGARRLGAAVAGFGGVAFVALVTVVIPRLNAVGEFSYWGRAGATPEDTTGDEASVAELIAGIFTGPKLLGLLILLLPVAFLALGSRISLLALPTVGWHLLAANPAYSGTRYHYGLVLMPIIFLAAADALPRLPRLAARLRLGRRGVRRAVPAALTAMVTAAVWFTAIGPYRYMVDPDWWRPTPYAEEAASALATVPHGATVAAHNRLAVHLVTDREVHLLDAGLRDAYGRIIDVEYVVAETTDGNWPITPKQRRRLLADLERCGYEEIYADGGFVTLRRTDSAPRGAALAGCLPEPAGRSAGR
jgi:uncharacterized membrane protein